MAVTPRRFRPPAVLPDPQAAGEGFSGRQAAALWFDDEQHNLARLVELAAERGMPDVCWKLAYALRDFYFRTKQWATWIRTHEVALAAAIDCGNPWAIAVTRNNLGLAYAETERLADAQRQYTEALALFRELDDPFGEANTLGHQAWVMHCLGRFREAVDLCRAALDFYRVHGQRRHLAITLRTMALAESGLAQYVSALSHLDEALAVFVQEDLPLDETMTHNCLGEVHARTADMAAARKQFRLAARRRGSAFEHARALRGLAGLAVAADRPRQAERLSQQAEALYAGDLPARRRIPGPRRPVRGEKKAGE